MYALNIGAVETSTEEARNSSTSLRLKRTRSESVLTDMPGSTFREHAGASVREPSSSTTQTRHTLTGVRLSRKHSVGVSMLSWRAASRMVEPSGTEISLPSILIETQRTGRGGGACGTGPGGTGTVAGGASRVETVGWVPVALGSLMKTNSIGAVRIQARWRLSGPARKLRHRAWLAPFPAAGQVHPQSCRAASSPLNVPALLPGA